MFPWWLVFQCYFKHTHLLPQDSDNARKSSARKQTKSYMKTKNRYSNSDNQWPPSTGTSGVACSPGSTPQTERFPYAGPQVRPFVKLVVTFCDLWGIYCVLTVGQALLREWWLFPKWPVKLLGLRGFLRSEVLVGGFVPVPSHRRDLSPFDYHARFHTWLSPPELSGDAETKWHIVMKIAVSAFIMGHSG